MSLPLPVIHRRGLMLSLSSPSGAGKTTIAKQLLTSEDNIIVSVSATTRPMRPGEQDGVDYHFVDNAQFEGLIEANALLEYAKVFDHYYGTPRQPVEDALADGRDVLFDIDWQGTQQIRDQMNRDLVSVFILPPSVPELERRLRARAQDSDTVIARRMIKNADEVRHWHEYDYVIINHDLATSVAQVRTILRAERLKRRRQMGLRAFVDTLLDQFDTV
jgi:guanylate kinase